MDKQTEELMDLLSEDELEFFNTLAPSYKKIFVKHVFDAKTEKTRLKNIDEVKEAMELKCKNIFDYKKKKNPRNTISKDASDSDKNKFYFDKVENNNNKKIATNLYKDMLKVDKDLVEIHAWNNPMIKYNETFICGVTVAKNHMTFAFEGPALDMFKEQIEDNGYKLNLKTFTIKYDDEIDMKLLKNMILFSIELKKDCTTFWY